MNIVVPLDENKIDVCMVFGRTPFFLIYNTETKESKCIDNPAAYSEGGAGLLAAQCVIDNNADILITPRCGENAAEVFKEAGIKIYKSQNISAIENIEYFCKKKLEEMTNFHKGFQGIQ